MAPGNKHLLGGPKRSCGWDCCRVDERDYTATYLGTSSSRRPWLRLGLFRRVSVLARVSERQLRADA